MTILKIIFTVVMSVILISTIAGLIFLGHIGYGPFIFLQRKRLKKLAGNAEKYGFESVEVLKESHLKGKRICFLGSSVTLGAASFNISFADYICKRNDAVF